MTRWKSFRYRLEEFACRSLGWLIPKFSRGGLVRFAHALGSLAFRLDRRGRAVALANLECVFGSRFTDIERAEIARRSYQNFVLTMLGLFWAKRLTSGNFRNWIIPVGFDELRDRLTASKRGAVFMCIHQGNWEWASLVCGFLGFGNIVVAENFKNPRLADIFKRLREHSGQTLIGQDNSLLRLLKVAKRGGATGMLIDLNLRPDQAATAMETFGPDGLLMCVPLLHAVLAERAGALLIPVETQPLEDGSCRVIAHPPVELPEGATISDICQTCWSALEPIIHARPHEYLWAYKHFRYRPKDTKRPYPPYSNESGKFEKLRSRAESGREPVPRVPS
jgi:Kdo2-lipid IVA lauroyltransferase/acyltransferase